MALFSEFAAVSRPLLGLGGFHVGKPADSDLAVEIVRHAVDAGFALLDNSWDYHAGESERRVGRALQGDGYRERVVVMTKVNSHSYDGLMRQFSESLERLGLSSIDLLQLHEVIRPGDGDDAVARGAFRALEELHDQGVVGHIGITGHKDPGFLVDAVDRAAEVGVRIETVQMPINAADVHSNSFTRIGLPALRERGVEVLGMKPLGGGRLVESGLLKASELLRWAMSQPVSVCITGCESLDDVDQAIGIRDTLVPMSDEERTALETRTAQLLANGEIIEAYKTTDEHDGTDHHPEWLV